MTKKYKIYGMTEMIMVMVMVMMAMMKVVVGDDDNRDAYWIMIGDDDA